MGHDGVQNEDDAGVEDAGGAEPCPLLQAGVNECPFRNNLGLGVLVVHGGPQWVADASPVVGCLAVAGFGDGADADNADLVGVRLGFNGLDDVADSTNVDLVGKSMVGVCDGGHHATKVDNVVGAVNAALHGLVVGEVSKDNFDVVLGFELLAEVGIVFVVGGEDEGNNIYLVCYASQ